ncbi:lipopolysaccharide assembly protein LapA domain-containing protein [Motilimonas cestriensis]|uniref:Probable lipopolysaccharide assembly protein A n=1 Tax=Motilimonas cestriensis TaxID=2742685 RepID=A0ABS8W681_9GAMM|nr:lipopolysaccharide assembly protein LapA domain-containing protein [Motilimonas cestriensis]MCE2593256.1 lipopolysaccharide assembly protein LapA domain-containing protein [Motilimonas cestriensis]
MPNYASLCVYGHFGGQVKAVITFIFLAILFAIAIFVGLKNDTLVTFNYLIAQSDVRLSVLIAITFGIAFTLGAAISSLLYLKLKISNKRLTKKVTRQTEELAHLRKLPLKD